MRGRAKRSRIPRTVATDRSEPLPLGRSVKLLFFSSAFCDPCIHTRAVLEKVDALVPAATIVELDIARDEAEAKRAGILSTPTIVVIGKDNVEVFRAEGAPTINQVLVALAQAV